MKRIQLELRKHGILIQMHLSLRDGLPAQGTLALIEAFRRAGFVAYSIERSEVSLTGEPCLALAFIDCAASAGVLSQAFLDSLDQIYDDDTPRPILRSPKALKTLNKLFKEIESVDVPRARPAREAQDL